MGIFVICNNAYYICTVVIHLDTNLVIFQYKVSQMHNYFQ